MRPRVKICGVTSPEEAVLAADLGADLVGLNFYPPSPRYLEPRRAVEVATAVRDRAGGAQTRPLLVGVFVNTPASEMEEITELVGLDLLQFHGDETPAEVAPFAARALKAFRIAPEARKHHDLERRGEDGRGRLDAAALAGYEGVWGILVDSRHPRLYGGTGESWSFESLRELGHVLPRRTFIAGGLEPKNVRAAIVAAKPYGIDLCSGVEAEPGRKDPELLERLFEEIRDGETATAA